MATARKKEIIVDLIERVRKFRFCSPSEDLEEVWGVTTSYRSLVIQIKRLAGPILPPEAASQLNAIDVEVNDINSALDADSELTALLPDIEAALETCDNTSMLSGQFFSKRNRYSSPKEITVREDAPKNLRYFILQAAVDLDLGPSVLLDVVCRVLRVAPDSSNWSEYPNIWNEVEGLVERCEWFRVYDVIEAIHNRMYKDDEHHWSREHLHRYLTEFDFRYNARYTSDSERALLAPKATAGKRLTLKQPESSDV